MTRGGRVFKEMQMNLTSQSLIFFFHFSLMEEFSNIKKKSLNIDLYPFFVIHALRDTCNKHREREKGMSPTWVVPKIGNNSH